MIIGVSILGDRLTDGVSRSRMGSREGTPSKGPSRRTSIAGNGDIENGVGPSDRPTAVDIRGAALADLACHGAEKIQRVPSTKNLSRDASLRRSSATGFFPGALPSLSQHSQLTAQHAPSPSAPFQRRPISRENTSTQIGLLDSQTSHPSSPVVRGSYTPVPPPTAMRQSVSAPDSQALQRQGQQVSSWVADAAGQDASVDFSPSRFPRMAAHRAVIAGHSSSSSTTSSPHTPIEASGIVRPRPPGDLTSNGILRPKRSSLNSSNHEPSSLSNSPKLAGRPPSILSHQRSSSLGGVGEGPGLPSPSSLSRTSSSRPGSAHRTRGVQVLIDAIRSKNEGKLIEALESFRQSSGAFSGLDAVHAVTGKTALHEAVTMNNIVAARLLLSAGASANAGHATQGPPLLCAAACGEVDMVELLLSSGANISATDSAKYSALHYACASGHIRTAQFLLTRGASSAALTSDGETPLDLAPDEAVEELTASFSSAQQRNPPPHPSTTSDHGSALAPQTSMLSLKAAAAALAASRNGGTSPHILPSPPKSVHRLHSAGGVGGIHSPGRPPTAPRSPGVVKLVNGSSGERSRPLSGLASSSSTQDAKKTPLTATLQIQATSSPPSSNEASPLPLQSSGRTSARTSGKSILSDAEDKGQLPSPVELQLPKSVQMQLKGAVVGGAAASDITSYFEAEDKQQVETQKLATGLIFGISPTQAELDEQQQQQQQGVAGNGSGLRDRPPSAAPSPHMAALAAAVPLTPKFRFGIDIYDVKQNSSLTSSPVSKPASSTHSTPQKASEDGRGSDTGGPPPMASNGSAIGSAITAAAGLALQSVDGGLEITSNSDYSAGDLSSAPPLLRVASPERSPRRDGDDGNGDLLQGFRAGRPPSSHRVREHIPGALRISQAAQALATRLQGTTTSTEALQAHATAMFKRSSEIQTGSIMWTRGELLGEGAFGKVYAGLNQLTGELMAVKALSLMDRKGNHMQKQLAELQQELEMYKKLSHKHVVGYIDSQLDEKTSTLYIFLEYVPGGSICSMLERFGKFSEELVRNYTRQLLLGLEYLHGKRIVHRDVKGGNVLVSRDGIVKLADFGASKSNNGATITDVMKSLKGSAFWMAPEVITGVGYGRRADIWSLGCTVIEMLTGKHPWPTVDNQWTAMHQIASRHEGPPRPPDCSELAADFLNQCFKYDPATRPNATELLQHPFVCPPEVTRRFDSQGGTKDLKRSI